MNIKIEIEVTPEELRRFLGLPDVAGMQDDMLRYVREKFSSSMENFDPATFVRENVKGSRPWKRLTDMANNLASEILAGAEEEDAPKKSPAPRKKSTSRSSSSKKS